LISGAMLLWPLIQRLATGGGKEVSVQQAVQLINRRDAVVLDVRDAQEFAAGHLPRARHIPLGELAGRLGEIGKFKEKPVIVTDRTGARSGAACRLLRKSGFSHVYQLKGGVAAWQQASLPVEK
jgi:rhodanese-related sulfurtransferase